MAGKYKKCPRCELNYILVEEDLCPVCKTELKLAPAEEDLELCTLCGKNLITVDQVMCDECARKRNLDDVVDEVIDEEDEEGKDTVSEWDQPIGNDDDSLGGIVGADDDVEVVSFSDLEDEEDDDDYDDDEESVDHFEEEDDFDIDNIDDYDDIDDDDDEDDDDDFDDDDFLGKKK